jgi:hypothetical protein
VRDVTHEEDLPGDTPHSDLGHSMTIGTDEEMRPGETYELFPGATQFAVLLNPKYPAVAQQVQEPMEAARTLDRAIGRTWHARGSTRSLPKASIAATF